MSVLPFVVLASCGGERRLVELRSPASVSSDGRTVTVGVASCNGRPSVQISESTGAVVAAVTSYIPAGDQDGREDVVRFQLSEPLGRRALIDGSNNAAIELVRRG